jgi:hypothetical protein
VEEIYDDFLGFRRSFRFGSRCIQPSDPDGPSSAVGIDVIGDYLTEINVTSPTCVRELDKLYNLNISATLLDVVTQKLIDKKKFVEVNRLKKN